MPTTRLIISFDTASGGMRTIAVVDPDTNLTSNNVHDAVIQIMENDVFDPAVGSLSGFRRAELVTVTRTQLL